MKGATIMTYRGSSGGIETLQIIDKKRRGPRMHVCIPVLILWDEQGQARSEKAQTLTISWFGCAVLGYSALRPGWEVQVYRDGKAADARVVYSLQDHVTQLVEVGLEFFEDGRSFWELPALNQ
jgi:hypothetical protein